MGVTANVVSEPGDAVNQPGILQDVQCVSRGLPGYAVVGAQAGDRGCRLAWRELSCGDPLA